MTIAQRIEGILFYKAEPVSVRDLAKLLSCTEEECAVALAELRSAFETRGVKLLTTDNEVTLVTAPELSELIETMRKDELKRDIGKAGAETLAIILYRGPVSRAEIDFIRGVNSSFILRNLLVRGLISREQHPQDARTFRYIATPELLSHMGVTNAQRLPEYQTIMNELDRIEKENAGDHAISDTGISTQETSLGTQ